MEMTQLRVFLFGVSTDEVGMDSLGESMEEVDMKKLLENQQSTCKVMLIQNLEYNHPLWKSRSLEC